jgi:hypothetical protein
MNTRENDKPKLTAEAAYENAYLVAQDLVQHIEELLFNLPAPGKEQRPINWADVGSLNEVNKRLSLVVAFLEGADELAEAPTGVLAGGSRPGAIDRNVHGPLSGCHNAGRRQTRDLSNSGSFWIVSPETPLAEPSRPNL